MQRVITINLNGAAYQLEEAAYDRLRAYLDDAARTLADNPDKAEILADFERAIGDKCRRYLGASKTVVVAAEMEAILVEMGPVDGEPGAQPASESSTSETAGTDADPASSPAGPAPRKRLYRLRGRGGIAGVCAGLAAYLGIGTQYIRFAFFLFIVFTQGYGLILYVLLTVVVPEAQTSDEWAAAHGERFDAKSVIEEAKRHAEEIKKDLTAAGDDWRQSWKRERRQWRAQQRAWRREWRAQSPHVSQATHVPPRTWSWVSVGGQQSAGWAGFALALFGMLSFAALILLIGAIGSVLNSGAIYGWAPPPGVPVWATILMLIAVFQLVNSPLRYARHASYHAWGRPHLFAAWDAVIAMLVMIAIIVMLYQRMPPPDDLGEFIRHLPEAFRVLMQDISRWFSTLTGGSERSA